MARTNGKDGYQRDLSPIRRVVVPLPSPACGNGEGYRLSGYEEFGHGGPATALRATAKVFHWAIAALIAV